ncbi:MAG: hypothetical protein OWU33_02420 [Firmicutes bacterium]|nr:hypothetical protein [Bacillota bacterium]
MSHFVGAKKLGATDAEIAETIQLAGSVGAGVMLAMADRARGIRSPSLLVASTRLIGELRGPASLLRHG